MPDLSSTILLSAFTAGILMSFAPCTLPLIPAFLASLVPPNNKSKLTSLLIQSIYFCFGFSFVFICFGILAGYAGSVLSTYKLILSQIGAVFIIIFALSLFNIIKLPFKIKIFNATKNTTRATQSYTPVVLGSLFALGWSPCAGPLLVSILLLASNLGTAMQGGVLLAIFSLGLSLPFILLGALYGHTLSFFKLYEQHYQKIRIVSGVFLLSVGIIMLFGQSFRMTEFGFMVYNFFGYIPMCTYI